MCLLVFRIASEAAELKVLSATGMQMVMEDLGPKFERATGHKLTITFASLGRVVKRVLGGETADVLVIPRQGIDGFVKDGKTSAGNVTVVARSGIGVAVRRGAPKPDISSPEALKNTLLAAKSIAYTKAEVGGASGIHFTKVLDRLGIANEMKAKTVSSETHLVGVLVENGEAEIAVQLFHELFQVTGIEIVGPRWTFGRRHAVRACAVFLTDLMPRKKSRLSRYLLNA